MGPNIDQTQAGDNSRCVEELGKSFKDFNLGW